MLKYVLKPEQGSQTFTNILKSLTEDAADDCQVRKVFQKIIMRTTSEHDVSRPECFKLFSDQKFVKFSRPFRCVNILDTRRVNTESEDNVIATKENHADIYWKREQDPNYQRFLSEFEGGSIVYPKHPKEISLYEYVGNFTVNWCQDIPHIPHPTPLFRYAPNKSNVEYFQLYCKTKILLHLPGVRPDDLEDSNESIEKKMDKFVNTNYCPSIVRNEYLKSLKQDNENSNEVEPEELLPSPLNQDEDVEPWIEGLGPINVAQRDIEETEEEIDMEVDDDMEYDIRTDPDFKAAEDYIKLGMNEDSLKEACDWVERTKMMTTIEEESSSVYDHNNLNHKQKVVFNILKKKIDEWTEDEKFPDQGLIDVSGGAGTGKTFMINCCVKYSQDKSGVNGLVRVCAFTNSAAGHFIGGTTIHKLFHLPVGSKDSARTDLIELSGTALDQLQQKFSQCLVVIIDEKSMIGLTLLSQIDQRLKQARPQHSTQPFGGLTIVLCGDLSQLPPVGDLPFYSPSGGNKSQCCGRVLYQNFDISIFLDKSLRQTGDTMFKEQLDRINNGTFFIAD